MRLRSLLPLVAAGLFGLAGAAHSTDVVATPDAAGNFVLGGYHLTVAPTDGPATPVFYEFPASSQDYLTIASNLATAYGTNADQLRFVISCDSLASCPGSSLGSNMFSLANGQQFDYLSIKAGDGELFFHWALPVTSVNLSILEGWPLALENVRAYLTTPVPGAFALFLTALAFFGLRRRKGGQKQVPPPQLLPA